MATCGTCQGKKYIHRYDDGRRVEVTCPACNGTGEA
jgi:DnaJ-class molecular chaperone